MSWLDKWALNRVVNRMTKEGPQSPFAKEAFVRTLKLMPAVPNVPGLEILTLLARTMVPTSFDFLLINEEGKFLLTRRDEHDPYYGGKLHLPGVFCESEENGTLRQANRHAVREFGEGVRILSIKHLAALDNRDCKRIPHFALLIVCTYAGTPIGEWHDTMPPDLASIHYKYWPVISEVLKDRSDYRMAVDITAR